MRIPIVIILCVLSWSLHAQDATYLNIKNHHAYYNENDTTITLSLIVDFPEDGIKMDNQLFDNLKHELLPKLKMRNNNSEIEISAEIEITCARNHFEFKIFAITKELFNEIIENKISICITLENNIEFEAWKNSDLQTLQRFKINKSQIKDYASNNPTMTISMEKEYIKDKGGEIYLTQNRIDLGIIPSTESSSSQTEFTASFKYRTKYSFLENKLPIFFSADGLISSNSNDSLNYISIYPVNYNFFRKTNELVGQIGIEGNQIFTDYRISGNFYWNGIIPNIVDLTFGADRLRLKPVAKAGIKFYQEVENSRPKIDNENKFSNQVFGELYYYIPIQEYYSLIIDCKVFYDFNTKTNPNNNIMFNYSAAFGIDIPKTDFKTIFKYSKGENVINYQKNEYFLIGLLISPFN
ncbi:MAG: hypothetical protein ACERKD_09145 [Prolixibacteraceae bacterium]